MLDGDVTQALGQLGEQGRNLDSSAALVAALALASAVLAVPALDPGARAGRRPGAARHARGGGGGPEERAVVAVSAS